MRRKSPPTPLIRVVLDPRDARLDRWVTRADGERLLAEGKLVSAVIYASERCYVPVRRHQAEVARYFLPRDALAIPGRVNFHTTPSR